MMPRGDAAGASTRLRQAVEPSTGARAPTSRWLAGERSGGDGTAAARCGSSVRRIRCLETIATVATLVAAGCATPASTVRKVEHPDELRGVIDRDLSTQVRLISATGESTGWLPSAELVRVGDLICLKSDDLPWSQITAIRVSSLTDANIGAILVDLPRPIRVVHLGSGATRLETGGIDLAPWVRSAAHDPADVGVARYHVMAWGAWRGPLTWAELQRASRPLLGWPVAGASAELRDINTGGDTSGGAGASAAIVALAIPFVIIAAGISVAGHMSSPLPSDEPWRPRRGRRATDAPLALVGEAVKRPRDGAEGQGPSRGSPRAAGSWAPRPCYRSLPPEAKP